MKKAIALAASAVVALSLAFAAPVFNFSKDAKMNLVMKGETLELAVPAVLKLSYWHINKSIATFIFDGGDVSGIYDFYDLALGAQGWKDAPVMGLQNGIRKDRSYAGTYAMDGYTLSFTVKAQMGKVRVHLEVK